MQISNILIIKLFALYLGSLLLFSCSNKKRDEFANFDSIYSMEQFKCDSIYLENCFSPSRVLVYDTILILNDRRDINMFLKFYCINNHQFLKGFGVEGKGPNEYINPSLFTLEAKKNILMFVEYPKRLVHHFLLDNIIFNNNSVPKPLRTIQVDQELMPFNGFSMFTDTSLLVSASNTNAFLSELSFKGSIIRTFGSVNPTTIIDNSFTFNALYRNYLFFDGEQALLAFQRFNRITRFCKPTGVTADRFGDNFFELIPEISSTGNVVNNFSAFTSNISQYGDFYMVAYLGGEFFCFEDYTTTSPSQILAFDEALNPKAKLIFPFGILDFTIDEHGKMYIIPAEYDGFIKVYNLNEIPLEVHKKNDKN